MPVHDKAPAEAGASREQVLNDVKAIIADQMGTDPGKMRETDHLMNDLGCDSLDVIEITMATEEHFGITVPDNVAEQIETVGAMADGVLDLLSRQAPSRRGAGEPVPWGRGQHRLSFRVSYAGGACCSEMAGRYGLFIDPPGPKVYHATWGPTEGAPRAR